MQAFIFDMDGVIIDSEPLHIAVEIETVRHFGGTITEEQLAKYMGMTNAEMWEMVKQECRLAAPVEEIIDYQLSRKIHALRELDIEPIEGIRELIRSLKQHGVKIAIASSSPMSFIQEVVQKFGIAQEFDLIMSGEEVERGKPAPDIYLEAARRLVAQPDQCIVLEDSGNGVAAAKSAGMKCIGFMNPNSGHQDLSQADFNVTSIRDIGVQDLLSNG